MASLKGGYVGMICERCGKETTIHRTSYLNTENICPDCEQLEKKHPVYDFAKSVERAETLKGNYNFEGVLYNIIYDTPAEANLLARMKFNDTRENIYKAWLEVVSQESYSEEKYSALLKANGL